MTEHNHELGRHSYAYAVLERHLETILAGYFGEAL